MKAVLISALFIKFKLKYKRKVKYCYLYWKLVMVNFYSNFSPFTFNPDNHLLGLNVIVICDARYIGYCILKKRSVKGNNEFYYSLPY